MEHKNIKKTVGIASMSLAVIAGTAAGVKFYNSGNIFVPGTAGRDFVVNQVRFDNDKDMMGKEDNKKGNDSSFWEQNKKGDDDSYGTGGNSGYLFDGPQTSKPSQDDEINIITPNPGDGKNPLPDNTVNPGPIYNITDDKDKADTIISGGGDGNNTVVVPSDGSDSTNTDKPGTDTDNNNGGNNNNGGDTNNGDTNNGGDANNDNNGSGDNNGSNDKPDNNDSNKRPADTAKDPDSVKDNPIIGMQYKPFNEKELENTAADDIQVIISMNVDSDSTNALYKGQSASAYMAFCALDTYVYDKSTDTMYYLGDSSFNKYIRIDGMSFDGGNTWNTQFPVTIPEKVNDDDMLIRVSYKLTSSAGWEQRDIKYTPMSNRIFVLSEKLKENNQTISNKNVLNNSQFVALGSMINLYACQDKMLEDGRLSALFPGWEENGQLVSWMYPATAGRHILEPADMEPLDDKYIVYKIYQWITTDGATDVVRSLREYYCPLQTLTGISGESVTDTIDVPQYVQAVKFDEETETEYIKIPDTVLNFSNDKLHVTKGYIVDEENPNYRSSRGVLVNHDMTELVAIPSQMTWLDIPASVTSIRLTADNNISKIKFDADSVSELPEIDYTYLTNCKIVVNDSAFEEFLISNGETLAAGNNVVAMSSSPEVTYRLTNDAIVSSEGDLYKIIGTSGTSVVLPDDIRTICTGALEDADSLENIVLPDNGEVVLEKDCLKDTSVRTIICNTKEQLENVSSMIDEAGGENIELVLMCHSSDGYAYYQVAGENGGVKTVLAKAAQDAEEFDGTIENGTIAVDAIGTHAFAECTALKWVSLNATVKKIEDCAFINCKSLQGVLINSEDTVEIENKAFDGCDSIRFIASNAKKCIMADGYDPLIADANDRNKSSLFFMTLAGAEGYGANITEGSTDIARYDMVETGGSRILYGVDEYDMYYIALRSGNDISGNVELPEYTTTIGAYAFSGASDKFTLNWDDTFIYNLLDGAFYGSGLDGDLIIPDKGGILISDNVFTLCNEITSIKFEGTVYKLGKEVFVYAGSLKKVEFTSIDYWRASLYAGLFNGCNELTDIVFDDYVAPGIVFPSVGYEFRFNYEIPLETEKATLHLTVPEDSILSYIMDWRYYALGYVDYDTMWEQIQFDLFFDTFDWPEDEAVDAAVKEKVLDSENYVRALLGLDELTKPTDYFPYRENNGMVTLIDVSTARKEVDIGASYMGLPEGWYYDYIGKNAFSNCPDIEKVIIPDNLTGIESGAFTGAASESGGLVIECMGSTPYELIADFESGMFEFGIDDDKLTVLVPAGCKDSYIAAWSDYIDADRLNTIIKERENTEE